MVLIEARVAGIDLHAVPGIGDFYTVAPMLHLRLWHFCRALELSLFSRNELRYSSVAVSPEEPRFPVGGANLMTAKTPNKPRLGMSIASQPASLLNAQRFF